MEVKQEHIETSRMLGSIVSCLCRSSLGGSIIFICPDHFLGLFVLWSNWRLRVHVLGHFSKAIDLRGHMPRFTQQEADIWRKLSMGYNRYHVIYFLLIQLATDPHVTPLPPICVETLRTVLVFPRRSIWGGHMPRFTLKNEHFPIYLLRNPINVCWNPQNSAHFSEMIDLRGHMPKFTLKMNVFPSISWKTP